MEELEDAIEYIANRLRSFGRIGVMAKEKWGYARISCSFVYNFHSLTHPSYSYRRYPKWLWKLDVYYGDSVLKYTGLLSIIYKWQRYVYIDTYRRAINKWPHLKDNLLRDADALEWLEEAGLCKYSDYRRRL